MRTINMKVIQSKNNTYPNYSFNDLKYFKM